MNEVIEVLGSDIGYYGVKGAVRRFDSIETFSFPSLAVRKINSSVSTATDLLVEQNTTVEIELGGSTYIVDTSPDIIAGSRTIRTEMDNFPREEEYAALVYASIIRAGARHVRRLVLGLPLHTMRHAEFLKQRFAGKHDLRQHGVCIVESVAAVPQPLGSLAYLRATAPSAAGINATTCIIDSGWHSSDLITVERGSKIDLARSIGRPGGAAIVVREVARLVGETIGERIENIDRVDRALRLKQPLLVYGKSVDLEPFLSEALHVTFPIVRALMNVVGTCEDLVVYGTGGAAHYYAQALRHTVGFDVHTVDRPQSANAIGFLLAGEAASRTGRT
jgi:plasmid segregation protein ParM